MSIPLRHSSVVVLLALLGFGCVLAVETDKKKEKPPVAVAVDAEASTAEDAAQAGEAPAVAGDASAKAQDKKPTAKQVARKAEKKEREITYARMELALAEMEAQNNLVEANFDLRQAQNEQTVAQRNLEHFQKVTRPLELEDAQIDLDRGEESTREQKQELDELEAMYRNDDFAGTTKELVLQRGKNRMIMAHRQLELNKKRSADKRDHELAEKERELSVALDKASQGLAAAQAKLKKTQAQNELELLRSRHKLEDAQRGDDDEEEEKPEKPESKGP